MPSTVMLITPVASSLTRTVIFSISPTVILLALTIIVESAFILSSTATIVGIINKSKMNSKIIYFILFIF